MPNGSAQYAWDATLRRCVLVRTAEDVTADLRDAAIEAADAAAAAGITIHTVTFIQDDAGGDAEPNASLARNGGFAFHTPEPEDLASIL